MMKNWIFTFSLLLALGACDSTSTEPDTPTPGTVVPDEPVNNIRKDIPLNETELQVAGSANAFAYNLYAEMQAHNEEPNLIMSPLSVSLAFSMLNNGAAGKTQEEIQKVLGFEGYTAAEINGYYKKMVEAMASIDPQVRLESANSIWSNVGFPVLPEFITVNQEAFGAEIRNEDFGDPATLDKINNWASEKTHGMIPTILKKLEPNTRMLLMNALYFLGEWQQPFKEENTKEESFANADGSTVKVDMMSQMRGAYYRENDRFATIDLSYGNGAFYMQVILPHKGVALEEVAATLDKTIEWQTSCLEGTNAMVSVKLPRFKVEYDSGLIERLKALGMEAPFDPLEADFSNLSVRPLYVGLVKQKAAINVNEKGTEAAAVTVIGTLESAGPGPDIRKDFHVNRPFMFIIRELSSNAIFFMGEVNKL